MCGATQAIWGAVWWTLLGKIFRYSMNRITPKHPWADHTGRTGDAGDYLARIGIRPSMTTETPAKGG